jgi:hypothetical protein
LASEEESAGRGCGARGDPPVDDGDAVDGSSTRRAEPWGEPRAATQGGTHCWRWARVSDGEGGWKDDGGEFLYLS